MDLSTRRVQIGGIASSASGLWMSQIARNLTDAADGFFTGKRYLIHDRDHSSRSIRTKPGQALRRASICGNL